MVSKFNRFVFVLREIGIAFDSKHGLCAEGRQRLTRGDTNLDMFPDSTVYEYIPSIHGLQSTVSPCELVLAQFSSCIECLYKNKLYNC